MDDNITEQEINEALAGWLGWKLHYQEWDDTKEFPYYIPSGKPWRTHKIDSKPVPKFTRSLDAQKPLWEKLHEEG